jgi:hypothetical protein
LEGTPHNQLSPKNFGEINNGIAATSEELDSGRALCINNTQKRQFDYMRSPFALFLSLQFRRQASVNLLQTTNLS